MVPSSALPRTLYSVPAPERIFTLSPVQSIYCADVVEGTEGVDGVEVEPLGFEEEVPLEELLPDEFPDELLDVFPDVFVLGRDDSSEDSSCLEDSSSEENSSDETCSLSLSSVFSRSPTDFE